MTANVIAGNIVIFIASVIMVASGYLKSKQKTIYWQTIQISLSAISCFILKAVSGGIVNLLSIPRNILAYKNKLDLKFKLLIWLTTSTLVIHFNANGFIGYLPLVSTTAYIFLMDKLKDDKFKMLVIFTMIVWSIHDFCVKSYVSVLFNIGNIITSSMAIYRIRKDFKIDD